MMFVGLSLLGLVLVGALLDEDSPRILRAIVALLMMVVGLSGPFVVFFTWDDPSIPAWLVAVLVSPFYICIGLSGRPPRSRFHPHD